MTRNHPAGETKPLVVGAPLPPELDTLFVEYEDLVEELRRAECELLYACARHRKAWSAMRARATERDLIAMRGSVGSLPTLESDAIWSKRTGDVKWWAAEMTAQGTAVLALKALIDGREAAKRARDERKAVPRETGGTVRELVLAWNPIDQPQPTETQYNLTAGWLRASGGKPSVTPVERARIDELIRRYEWAHPEIFPRD